MSGTVCNQTDGQDQVALEQLVAYEPMALKVFLHWGLLPDIRKTWPDVNRG